MTASSFGGNDAIGGDAEILPVTIVVGAVVTVTETSRLPTDTGVNAVSLAPVSARSSRDEIR